MLITNACVVTVNDRGDVHQGGTVRVRSGQIEEVSPGMLAAEPGEEVVDASGQTLMPGLVNTHVHLFQTLLRGVFEEEHFAKFLSYMYACGTELRPEDSRIAAELGCVESLRAGVTTVVDHHFLNRGSDLALATAEGMRAAGVRAVVARTVMDIGDMVPPPLREVPDRALQSVDELVAACRPLTESGLLQIWTGPNTPGMNASAEAVLAVRDFAGDRGIGQSAHVAEYPGVLAAVRERYKVDGVVRWLEGIGALVPDFLAVHAIRVGPEEVAMLAASGASVSHNPFSNLVAGDRTAPVADYVAAGMTVGLGTDGAANNNSQTVLDAMKIARLLERLRPTEAPPISAPQALRMATIDGARAVGLGDLCGSIEVGKRADLILVDVGNAAHTVPLHDPFLQLVHAVKGSDVRSTMVDGVWVMRDRELLTIDEPAMLASAQQAAVNLVARLTGSGS